MRHSQVCLILPDKYSTFDMSDADSWLCAGNGGALGISTMPVLGIHQIFITSAPKDCSWRMRWPTRQGLWTRFLVLLMAGLNGLSWLTGNDQHFLIQVCKWHAVSWGDWNAERGWGGGRLTSCRNTFSLGESNWLSGEQTHDFYFISTSLQLIKLTIQSAPRTNTRKPRAKWIWRGRLSVYILNKPLTTFHALLREPSEPLAGHLTHSL